MTRLGDLELGALNPLRLRVLSQLAAMGACSVDHESGTVVFDGHGEQWLTLVKMQGSRFSRAGRLHRSLCNAMRSELRSTGMLRLQHESALRRFAGDLALVEQHVPEYPQEVDLAEAVRLGRRRASRHIAEGG